MSRPDVDVDVEIYAYFVPNITRYHRLYPNLLRRTKTGSQVEETSGLTLPSSQGKLTLVGSIIIS